MAFPHLASSSNAHVAPSFGFSVTEKLARNNYPLWKLQVSSALKGAQVASFIQPDAEPPTPFLKTEEGVDKKEVDKTNPEYETWVAKDQSVLCFVLGSLSKEISAQIPTTLATAKEAWAAIESMFASQSRARVISTQMALATATKGTSSIAEYYQKIKTLADQMASAGKKLEDEELISNILTGLGEEYDSVVSAVASRVEPISLGELYTQLTSFESRMEMRNGGGQQSAANMVAKGGRNSHPRGGGRGGDSGRGGFGRGFKSGRGGGRPQGSTFLTGVFCQLCQKEGHTVVKCFKRFNVNFNGPPPKSASTATTNSYGVDSNWCMDTGATDHITSDLERLTVRDKYHGGDQVHAANGSGMKITYIGDSILHSPSTDIHLKNILHVPKANKNLASVHRLTRDNGVFLEFHPNYFDIKEEETRRILLRGKCEGGLYPLRSSASNKSSPNKRALSAARPSVSLWHNRLGHASTPVVRQILSRHKLSFVKSQNKDHVCNACQQGKAHQLPYARSSSVSSRPLDLIFSDVWGPAPASVGRHKFYVSFIDDHSKFVWIYMLRHKSEVFQCFHDFQSLVERQFERKILAVQTDWGGEYQALNSFFKRIGISHHVSCPHAHQQNGSAERKHRHIVEIGLTLLSHSSMPLKFWDEAFSTAVYLINRLPSKVINNDTPFLRLFGKHPDYSSLRTFGCACWPNLRPYNTRKLEFRSKPCVFLGYSTLHKGFKCLDPAEGRVYVSRDVVFDEQVFPFASMHPNAGAQLRAELQLLPDILLNPTYGSGNLLDPNVRSSVPTNASQGLSGDVLNAGENLEGNNAGTGAPDGDQGEIGTSYHMCSPVGGTTTGGRSQVDLPG